MNFEFLNMRHHKAYVLESVTVTMTLDIMSERTIYINVLKLRLRYVALESGFYEAYNEQCISII